MRTFELQIEKSAAPTRSAVRVLRRLAVAAALSLPMLPGMAHAETPTLTLGGNFENNSYGVAWAKLMYEEAGKRMDVRFKIAPYPMVRRTKLATEGELDGDIGRAAQLVATVGKDMVRVEQAWMSVNFFMYTAKPGLTFKKFDDLKGSGLAVEYPRGVQYCLDQLKGLGLKRLLDAADEVQALRRLAAGTTDLYCAVDSTIASLMSYPEFKGKVQFHKAVPVGVVAVHPYLHKKHAALAPKLAETLKKMKDEGLIEKYQKQVEKELGFTP